MNTLLFQLFDSGGFDVPFLLKLSPKLTGLPLGGQCVIYLQNFNGGPPSIRLACAEWVSSSKFGATRTTLSAHCAESMKIISMSLDALILGR